MNSLIQDAHFTLRLVRKQPGAALLVVATLVLGIGLNTAVFSVINAVILRPLPVRDPDRILSLYAKVNRTGATLGISYPEFLDWKAQSRSFQDIATRYALSFTMTGEGSPEHLKAFAISASGFTAWGVNTILGREFTDDDDQPGSQRVVILNYAFWQRRYGGDSSVLGRSLTLDQQQYTVIGVLQPTQIGPLKYPDVWMANGPFVDQRLMRRDSRFFFPIARLKPNVTQQQAQAELDTIAARLAEQYPATNKDMGVIAINETELLSADGRKPLSLLIVASSLVFLLAAINVMTVFAGNTMERGRELSVRLALGASRSALLRQLFIQAVMFAAVGAGLGLLLAKLSLLFFLRTFPNALFRFQETTMDSRVIVATVAMTLLTSLTAIVLPCLYALKLNPVLELKGQWSSLARPKYRVWARGALILFEVALASGLMLVSSLLIRSFYYVAHADLGFMPSLVFSFQITPSPTRYKDPGQQAALYKAAIEKLTSFTGMESTSAISNLPLTNQADASTLDVEPRSPVSGQHLVVQDESVLPHFFATMKIPLVQGRDFNDADHDGAPLVVILDDVLAARLWPQENPLGKRVRITDATNGPPLWREVVGIVRETKHFGPERRVPWMQLYFPLYQNPTPALSFVIHTSVPESTVKNAAEQVIHELDRDLPVENFQPMDAYLDNLLSGRKISLFLLSTFAAIALSLGAIGIYGAVANTVVQRRREIAIRVALGATRARVMLSVTRFSLLATAAGIASGSGLVLGMTRLLASFLFGITTLALSVYLWTMILIMLVALTASTVPAVGLFRMNVQEILRQP